MRSFILSQLNFAQLEFTLYGALAAPHDDLFYQDADSPDWQLINANLSVSEIEDPRKYLHQLRTTMNNIMIGGATVF